ncbi:MAG: site-specific DNA-methyltransferase, partial [Pirellulaceae bacterium]|nr:site-specific DNA-methyltransferase [Pirellulaceae bacterium]
LYFIAHYQNVLTRHLNLWQKCVLVMPLIDAKPAGKLNQALGGRKGSPISEKVDRWEEASRLSGVSKDTLMKAKDILHLVDKRNSKRRAEETKRDLAAGNRAINAVHNDLVGLTNWNRKRGGHGKGKPPKRNHLPVKPTTNPNDTENVVVCEDWVQGMQRLPDNSVTIYVLSPPYLRARFDYGGCFNDDLTYAEYLDWLKSGFIEIRRTLRDGGLLALNFDSCLALPDERDEYYHFPIHADTLKLLQSLEFWCMTDIPWVKRNRPGRGRRHGQPGAIRIRREHEYITLHSKGKHFLDLDEDVKVDLLQSELKEWSLGHTWNFATELKHRQACPHPATFPCEIPYRLIKMFSYEGDLVVDPLAGTGTTLEAAKRLHRNYFGIDANSDYVEYARARLAKVKAEKL